MSKKLKIYCTLFVVVLVYLVVTSVIHFDSYGWGQGGHDKLEFVDEAPGFMTRDTLEGGEQEKGNRRGSEILRLLRL